MALSDLKQRMDTERRTAQLHLKVRPDVADHLRRLCERYDAPQAAIISELIMEASADA